MNKKSIILALALCLYLAVGHTAFAATGKPVLVSGTWNRSQTQSVQLYKVENGELQLLKSAAIDPADHSFLFALQATPAGSFYYIGSSTAPESRFAFYLKEGDQLSFAANDSSYVLTGHDNSVENQTLEAWHNFVQPLEYKAEYFRRNNSTYVDFFPLLDEKVEALKSYPAAHTPNKAFNQSFETYKRINFTALALDFLFKPRSAQPQEEDYADFYRDLRVADYTTTTDLLDYPGGVGFINELLSVKAWIGGQKLRGFEGLLEHLNEIPNDTLRGELVLMGARTKRSYAGLTDYEAKYANLFVTARQKALLQQLKTALVVVKKGVPATDFRLPDIQGKPVALSELKGKVVYIDFWATWCGPCKKEIPSLKKLEEEYHGQNIVFLSVSMDKTKDHEKWKNFVGTEQLKGIQLFAGDKGGRELSANYKISGIPRFVLVGADGNIVAADAPRPSSTEIRPLLNSLLK
ncbi:MAG: TlpA family protein disulfide reductase [Mediterranea sp.]|jgi:thiol-disulfide isomerase/thioredoxin|nr:TlpA family protein disulfide reductase [Mediterranea sp.]